MQDVNSKINDISLSIMIPIFNEEKHLKRVLKSALNVTPNVFIVDSQSNDASLSIAENFNCPIAMASS